MRTIDEAARRTPVAGEYDVVVAGGGLAGMAAAIAAARQGAKVCLVEKGCMLGGLGTLGLITIYLPLCDGRGHQVMFGLAEELLRLSIRHGAEAEFPVGWLGGGTAEERIQQRFYVQYNPALFAIEAERLLLSLGVTIHYDARACDVAMEGDRIAALVVEGKEGRQAIAGRAFVDGTGDADLCAWAGAPTVKHLENHLAMWYYAASDSGYHLYKLARNFYSVAPGERLYDGTCQADVDAMMIDGREKILEHFLKERKRIGDDTLFPAHVPQVPSFRMTRRLAGAYALDDAEQFQHFDDSIGLTCDWRKAGPVYEIPYRCLVASNVTNLITAGRCISVTTAMWDITRVIPVCSATGEAAGIAAAQGAASGTALPALPIGALQQALRAGGVRLHTDEAVPNPA